MQTVRQQLETSFGPNERAAGNVYNALNSMQMQHLADMPAISLSSGQTRRARIARALMTRPALLILEDPMAGLDQASRDLVDIILGELNMVADEARVVYVLKDRGEGTLSNWITHVCEVHEGEVWIGTAEQWKARAKAAGGKVHEVHDASMPSVKDVKPVVSMRDVSIAYAEGARKVLNQVNWDVKPGEKWHLQGANGGASGSVHADNRLWQDYTACCAPRTPPTKLLPPSSKPDAFLSTTTSHRNTGPPCNHWSHITGSLCRLPPEHGADCSRCSRNRLRRSFLPPPLDGGATKTHPLPPRLSPRLPRNLKDRQEDK